MSDYIRNIQKRDFGEERESTVPPSDSEYLRELMKGTTKSVVRVIGKERVYVDDPSEIPEGAQAEEGPEGGLYYETEQVEEFQREMQNMKEKTFQEYDWSEDKINAMESEIQRYEDASEEDWGRIMNAARSVGASGGSFRIKGVGSALEKVYERDNDYERPGDLNDIFASRVFADESRNTRETADAIINEFGEENIVEEKDYLEGKEKAPYYRAVHLIVDMGDGKTGEIQVKSEDMAEVAHVGHVAVYKDKLSLSDDEKDEVTDCLSSMMDVVMGQVDQPDCSGDAAHIIQEVHQQGDEAEV